jgi:hypothetical protein
MQQEFDLSTMEQTKRIDFSQNRLIPGKEFEGFLMPEGESCGQLAVAMGTSQSTLVPLRHWLLLGHTVRGA